MLFESFNFENPRPRSSHFFDPHWGPPGADPLQRLQWAEALLFLSEVWVELRWNCGEIMEVHQENNDILWHIMTIVTVSNHETWVTLCHNYWWSSIIIHIIPSIFMKLELQFQWHLFGNCKNWGLTFFDVFREKDHSRKTRDPIHQAIMAIQVSPMPLFDQTLRKIARWLREKLMFVKQMGVHQEGKSS